ncbi:MAG: chemotaxis protein CheA [Nitrospirae bacterium]|nr:MAG: chemotaxis protein CheA [Nitrospirota bacterium]
MNTDQCRETYREEASELLTELETSLLELEESPEDKDLIGRVFRAMHTIKGSGAMFGFDNIAKFTHEVETVFDQVRNGKLPVTKNLINLTLDARDQIRAMLDGGNAAVPEKASEIVAGLKALQSGGGPVAKQEIKSEAKQVDVMSGPVTYRIRFKPSSDLFKSGTNPINLLNELRQLGEHKIVAHTTSIPLLGDLDPELCYTYWDIILTTGRGENAIKDVFIFVEDMAEVKVDVIDDGGSFEEVENKKIGEILLEKGDLSSGDLKRVLGSQKRAGELLIEAGVVDRAKVEAALVEQQHLKEVRDKREKAETATSIRVPSEKLDMLVNLVGELVTVQARLSQTAISQNESSLLSISEEVERLTWELRDQTMNIRLLPIGTTFSKFKRLVRDLSRDLGKVVELTTSGAETELDKTVIEKLNDPLVHLIRNSLDHGVELPEEREKDGKPRSGTIHLSAAHSGAQVLIEIADDGKGLDPEVIRKKGVEKGLISADAELSEKEIFALILAPGFSTAKTVTSVSGRGVGMDVVKRAIDELRGTIEITSWKGQGTTISLKLPLTLAIIDGLLVKIGDGYFVLTLSSVEECVELTKKDVESSHGRNIANVRGQIIPYIRLREEFNITGKRPGIEQIVITATDSGRVGFVVDQVVGEHQTVIKSLGRFYKNVEGLSGATILGDGTVALILDVAKLYEKAEISETAS